MKLGLFIEAAPPPVVTYSVFVDDYCIGEGLPREEAQRLYDESFGYVVMENQHGACYAYKGRGRLGGDEDDDEQQAR